MKELDQSVSSTYKYEERLGLVVLTATLLVALVIIGFVFKLQHEEQRNRVLQKGQYLLNSFTTRQHDTEELQVLLGEFLRTAPDLEGESLFAYLIIRDIENNPQAKVTKPGVIVPPFFLAKDPADWHSRRSVSLPENKRVIHELNAPLLAGGELIGSISLGFFDPAFLGVFYNYRFLAILVLPVVLVLALGHGQFPPLTSSGTSKSNVSVQKRFHSGVTSRRGSRSSSRQLFVSTKSSQT